jgi:DNA-binding transcriptional LysR family regulator
VSRVAQPVVSDTRPAGVVFRPLREPTPMLGLVAAWRRDDRSAHLQAFLEVIREFAPVEIWSGSSPAPDEHPTVEI